MEKGKNSCYVIGSGVSYSIENLVETVFEYYDLDWKKYVDVNEKLLRQGDPKEVCSDPKILKDEFDWKCNYTFYDLIDRCIKKIIINRSNTFFCTSKIIFLLTLKF